MSYTMNEGIAIFRIMGRAISKQRGDKSWCAWIDGAPHHAFANGDDRLQAVDNLRRVVELKRAEVTQALRVICQVEVGA